MPTGLPSNITTDDTEWVLHFCNFFDAWKMDPIPNSQGKKKGEGITIVHPDTGWTLHPELLKGDRYLFRDGKNFTDSSLNADINKVANDTLDSAFVKPIVIPSKSPFIPPTVVYKTIIPSPSHGTVTASVMMSERGNPNKDDPNEFPNYEEVSRSITGVAPLIKVLPHKVTYSVVLDAEDFIGLAKSIYYTLAQVQKISPGSNSQIGVISISLGGFNASANSSSLKHALKAARKAGVIVVAAAGQLFGQWSGAIRGPIYPGNDSNTICVAGCNFKHEKYIKGFYGPTVDISAPSEEIWQARSKRVPNFLDKHFVDKSDGTSYATAFVAGACALWQSYHNRGKLLSDYGPELIFDLFKKVLIDSCETVPTDINLLDPPPNLNAAIIPEKSVVVRTPNGIKHRRWDTKKQGAGVLDAKRLLEHPLPTKQELINSINNP